jgi:hypothetical protein
VGHPHIHPALVGDSNWPDPPPIPAPIRFVLYLLKAGHPARPVQPLSRPSLLALARPRPHNAPKHSASGPRKGPKMLRSQAADPYAADPYV